MLVDELSDRCRYRRGRRAAACEAGVIALPLHLRAAWFGCSRRPSISVLLHNAHARNPFAGRPEVIRAVGRLFGRVPRRAGLMSGHAGPYPIAHVQALHVPIFGRTTWFCVSLVIASTTPLLRPMMWAAWDEFDFNKDLFKRDDDAVYVLEQLI